MASLEIRDLKRHWPDFRLELDFIAESGSLTSLLGPSGCGKTSTLRLIAGLDSPHSGDILLDGVSILGIPTERRGIGFVFQDYALFPHLDVFENIAFGLRVGNRGEDEVQHKVSSLLSLTGLKGFEKRAVSSLSGGERQRVALARALAIEPSLLLLDEPLSSLDFSLRKKLRKDIRSIQRKLGITTIYVTHDRDEAFAISDSIVLMHDGAVLQQGTPDEIYYRPKDEFAAELAGPANIVDASFFPGAKLGKGARIMFRPEDSRVSKSGRKGALKLSLLQVSYFQGFVEFVLEKGITSVMFRRELDFTPEDFIGRSVYLSVSSYHVL